MESRLKKEVQTSPKFKYSTALGNANSTALELFIIQGFQICNCSKNIHMAQTPRHYCIRSLFDVIKSRVTWACSRDPGAALLSRHQGGLRIQLDVPAGAPCHTAHSVVEFLEQACPPLIEPDAWPPKGPDLNPLDFFVWSDLDRMVYRGQRISTIEELKERLTACWDQLSQRLLARAVGGVPKRLQACVTAHGARFEHMLG